MKKAKLLIASTIISMVLSITAFAGEWKQNTSGWWYQNDDGSYSQNAWLQDNEKWYHFDANGYMQTGWLDLSSTWYYLNQSGEMQTSPIYLDGITYNFNKDGACINRWEGLEDVHHYDKSTGTWKNVGAEMAELDIINRLTGPIN